MQYADIVNHKFDKTMGFGYKADEVDAFLAQLAEEFSKMESYANELEEKMAVLAEKLEEYRNDEESLRSALIGAQKLGDSVVKEARQKAEIILRDATIKSDAMVENVKKEIAREQIALSRVQKEVSVFKASILSQYKRHIELLNALPEVPEEKPAPAPAAAAAPAPAETPAEAPVQATAPAEEPVHEEAKPAAAPAVRAAEDDDINLIFQEVEENYTVTEPSRSESRFGSLKFGEAYQLQHEDEAGESKFLKRRR